ncbi:DUF5719 family protein [Microbacterium immunditiarum]|uniref:Large extracellular alpha-helical protein n=1 Tax=Microbacterium immunditiarum TaxID=337480 RepID=A0A7Y9GR03_9MICO|nr:DUF5719 family protein [Microbacterium immunditiarum]NYE21001.1 hypothetical protein [Microbacterium immunditiarum]
MSDRRIFRWATTGARAIAGTVVAVAFVVAVVTAAGVPWPTYERRPVEVAAMPVPSASVLVCSGDLLALGQIVEDPDQVVVAASQSVVSGAEDGAMAEFVLGGPGAPRAYSKEPDGSRRVAVAASGAAAADTPFLRGYAASACRPPLIESWLVGGSGETGAADIVVISNPGRVAATVELTVFGATGPVVPPGGAAIVIPAGQQHVVPLAGLARGEASPIVRVSASGAPVTASLQTSITRTLATGGVDQVEAIASPETDQIIAGVPVMAGAAADGQVATIARVLSPTAAGTATLTVTDARNATPAREPQPIALSAGLPIEVDLGGLPPGDYTVEVTADVPILAAVWQTTDFAPGADFAWYTPAPELEGTAMLAVPAGPLRTLSLVNRGEAEAIVSVSDGEQSSQTVVPPLGSTVVRIATQGLVTLEATAPVHASLSLTGDGALAGFPVWPADTGSESIVVYP